MQHTRDELKQMQALPLDAKIEMSKQRIKEWYDAYRGGVCCAFSGGKDSTVLKHLIENTDGCGDVPSVFVDTGLEYPEVRSFAMEQPNVVVLKPKLKFNEVIKKYGYPVISKEVAKMIYEVRTTKSKALLDRRLYGIPNTTGQLVGRLPFKYRYLLDAPFKISSYCCDVMKKSPMHIYETKSKRKGYNGMMADESRMRLQSWLKAGCNAFDQKWKQSRPLMFWTEQDVLKYIKENHLRIADVYGDVVEEDGILRTTNVDRTGCMFCMFGCHKEAEPNRFQKMKETHPAQYKYCMDKLGLREVLDYIGVPYE